MQQQPEQALTPASMADALRRMLAAMQQPDPPVTDDGGPCNDATNDDDACDGSDTQPDNQGPGDGDPVGPEDDDQAQIDEPVT